MTEKKEKIEAMMIFEIFGRPKEYLNETLEKLLETIGKENGIAIKNKKIHEPKLYEPKDKDGNKIEVKQESFTSFAEAEIEAEDIMDLLRVMFTYMPAHVEIIKPENFNFTNIDFNSISNEILRRLHNYDSIAKAAIINNQIIAQKFKEYIEKTKAEKENEDKNEEVVEDKKEAEEKKEDIKEDDKVKNKKRKSKD